MEPEQQEAWLARAAENHWTVKELREAIDGQEDTEGEDESEGEDTADEELEALIEELDDYISKLDSSHRSAAIKRVLRNLKALANTGKGGAA